MKKGDRVKLVKHGGDLGKVEDIIDGSVIVLVDGEETSRALALSDVEVVTKEQRKP